MIEQLIAAATPTPSPPIAPRIAVFRGLRGLGDMLVAVPALRVLRAALPDAHVALIGLDTMRPVAERLDHLYDEYIDFPGWDGIPERSAGGGDPEALDDWRGADAVVQMHGDGSVSNRFCSSLEPHSLVAYGECDTPDDCVVSTARYPRHLHEIDRCIGLAERTAMLMGAEPGRPDRSLEWRTTRADAEEAAAAVCNTAADSGSPCDRPYYVLHPGARLYDHRWPAEAFAHVGRALARNGRVLVTGAAEETEASRETARLVGDGAASVAGELSLGGLAALLQHSSGVITNDTGISHLADAVNARSVVVFMASDPHRWAPLDESLHASVAVLAREGEPGITTPEGLRLATPPIAAVLQAASDVGMLQ